MKQKIKKRILPTLLISCALPIILFISTPFDLFAGNYGEFVFSFANFFWMCLLFFMVVTALIFLILLFLPNRAYRIVSAIFLGLAFLMFVQTNLLNSGLSSLAGDGSSCVFPTSLIVWNAIVWVAVLALFVGLACIKDKNGIVASIGKIVALVLVVTQVITPVFSAISNHEMFLTFEERMSKLDDDYSHMILTNKNLTTAASEGNIFVFCVDRFDEFWVESAYEKSPELFTSLGGFTWYQDHTARFGHTYPSIANMLTGAPFVVTDEGPHRIDYLNSAYTDYCQNLNLLQSEGWKINIYTERYYSYNDAYYLPNYVENRNLGVGYKVTNPFMLGFKMVQLGTYRTMPFFIKSLYHNLSSGAFAKSVQEYDADGNKEYLATNDLVDQWTDMPFTKLDGKGFYFIHTSGLHQDFSRVVPNLKINMKIINKYFNFLKQEGLYKDATIIITGDHGAGSIKYDKKNINDPQLTGMFIKPAGVDEGGEIEISYAPTSHDQLWTTILEQAGAKGGQDFGKSILETHEGDDVTREFTWHTYNCELVEYNYTIHGSARDFNNWTPVGEPIKVNRNITD